MKIYHFFFFLFFINSLYGESENVRHFNKISVYQSFGPDDSNAFYFHTNLTDNIILFTYIYGADLSRITKEGGEAKVSIRECTQKPQKCIFYNGVIIFNGVPKDEAGGIVSGAIIEYDSRSNAVKRKIPFNGSLLPDRREVRG